AGFFVRKAIPRRRLEPGVVPGQPDALWPLVINAAWSWARAGHPRRRRPGPTQVVEPEVPSPDFVAGTAGRHSETPFFLAAGRRRFGLADRCPPIWITATNTLSVRTTAVWAGDNSRTAFCMHDRGNACSTGGVRRMG